MNKTKSKPKQTAPSISPMSAISDVVKQLKDLTLILECPKNYQAFFQWKLKLSDIINTDGFLMLLERLQYGEPKVDDGRLRKEAEHLWGVANSITQQDADNYEVLGRVDDVRFLVNDLAEMLERKGKILEARGDAAEDADELKKTQKQHLKEPPREAIQAYNLTTSMGKTQQGAAEIMSKKLHRKVEQYEVSRWVEQVRKWYEANGLPVEPRQTKREKEVSIDPSMLDMGPRWDGISQRQRHKKT